MDDGVDEPERCGVCGGNEPCSHDFDKIGDELAQIGSIMGQQGGQNDKLEKSWELLEAQIWGTNQSSPLPE